MKVAVLALFALAFVGTSRAAPQKAGGEVFDTIKSLLALAKLAIPDEVSVDPGTLEIPENDVESGTVELVELSLNGLKTLDYTLVEQLSDDEDTINLNLGFGEINAHLHLHLNLHGILDADDAHVHILLDITDLNVQAKIGLPLDESDLEDFYLLITVGDIIANVEGIGSEELSQEISQTVTENLADIIDTITQGIAEPVSTIIKFVVNVIDEVNALYEAPQ